MKALQLLIKPASSACNLRCRYCFYLDIANEREQAHQGMMTISTLTELVREALAMTEEACTFAFQGGEPTLAGLDFYRTLIDLQKQYNVNHAIILNTIQTNGILIDEEWARFLHENHFLVGLSLDGPSEIQNINRMDTLGKESFNRVLKCISLLKKYKVEFNILSVVTGQSARNVEKIYRFFKKHDLRYLQFIPCMEPLAAERGDSEYHLSPQRYADFLCRLFDLWYMDMTAGTYVSIRLFDNLVHMLAGNPPEACNMRGQCSVNLVVEGNGNVYPCDFYALDQWLLGQIGKDPIADMMQSERALRFITESVPVPETCKVCSYFPICRNGCKRDRVLTTDGDQLLYYCESYRIFFDHALPRLKHVARQLSGRA